MRLRGSLRRSWPALLLCVGTLSCVAVEGSHVGWRTLGGKQFWTDVQWQSGWRIQRHAWTGHHRLLDAGNVRWASGDFERCAAELGRRPRPAATTPATELVVCVHGLGRSRASMAGLAQALSEAGHPATTFGYASTRASIGQHADDLAAWLGRLEGVQRVSFVTHSLGGVVVRELLSRGSPAGIEFGCLVQIAPPNRRSELARRASSLPLLGWVLGPAASQLAEGVQEALPGAPLPTLVLAGQRGSGEGFNPLLNGADDGVVTLAETRLAGASWSSVEGLHTFLMDHPDVRRQVLEFLSAH